MCNKKSLTLLSVGKTLCPTLLTPESGQDKTCTSKLAQIWEQVVYLLPDSALEHSF